MLRNFVVDADLKKYYPNFARYVPSQQSDWSTQISEAFNLVLDDFVNRGHNPRTLGTMLDLNRAMTNTSDQNGLQSLTKTVAYNGTWIEGQVGFRRLVLNVTAITGAATIVLQGSNDVSSDSTNEPGADTWETIVTANLSATGEVSSNVFQKEYKWYRLVVTPGTSIAWTAGVAEVYVDRLIVWRAFGIIYTNLSKERDDVWAIRAKEAMDNYESAFRSVLFFVDANQDNLINSNDSVSSGQIRFTR